MEGSAFYALWEFGIHNREFSSPPSPQLSQDINWMQIRIFFRLIEFSDGNTSSNPFPYHEVYFYVLEAVPMCLAILCYNVTHPGTVLQGPEARLPTIRSLVFKKRRGRKQQAGSGGKGGVEMGSNYVELGEESISIHVELEGKDPREGRNSFREKFRLW